MQYLTWLVVTTEAWTMPGNVSETEMLDDVTTTRGSQSSLLSKMSPSVTPFWPLSSALNEFCDNSICTSVGEELFTTSRFPFPPSTCSQNNVNKTLQSAVFQLTKTVRTPSRGFHSHSHHYPFWVCPVQSKVRSCLHKCHLFSCWVHTCEVSGRTVSITSPSVIGGDDSSGAPFSTFCCVRSCAATFWKSSTERFKPPTPELRASFSDKHTSLQKQKECRWLVYQSYNKY